MIKAWVMRENFPEDLIGEQEFIALPDIGMSILVIDKNANSHTLKVKSVRMQGVRSDSEMLEFMRERSRNFGFQLVCVADPDWQAKEAGN